MEAVQKANLPLELLNKHREALGLADAFVFDSEDALFADHPSPLRSAVVFLPKSRALIDMTLALVSGKVAKGGMVALVGANDAGIGSAKKAYEKNIGPVEQKIVGNHSALYIGKNARLAADKTVADFMKSFVVEARKVEATVADLPGVFSSGELDEGTRLLIEHLPLEKARVLDVGCGAGVIGAIYSKLSPKSEITASDMSILAVMAAKETARSNDAPMAVVRSDVFSGITGLFDLIVTNPPFHTGISTDYSFIEKFARDARKHIAPKGEVFVVANSFLSYKDILEKGIGPTEAVANDGKFTVWRSTKA